jgi:iron uptake system component EfeO
MRAVALMAGVAASALLMGACGSSAKKTEAESTTTAATVPLTGAAQQAVDDYRDYIREQASTLVTETQRFADAVKAGNIEAAKQLFPVARAPYERIEPVAEAFGDLDPQIDARDGDVPADEWGGFHKIEQALWEKNTTADMGAVADKLVADVKKLDAAIPKFELTPEGVANGAVELLNEVGTSKVTGEEDRYSHTDLYDFEANVEGAREALKVVTPIIAKKNAELAPQLNKEFAAVLTSLAKYKTGDTYKPYTDLTDADTKALGTQVDALADKLSAVPPLVVNS